jgi:RES domain-containing protein
MLEVLVHLAEESRGIVYHAFPVDLPDELVRTFPDADLPTDWRNEPIPPSTQAVGETWLREGTALALQVPSVVVPPETNVILNPHHPDFERITVGKPQEVGFDARIWQP